jgi:hypothetical protein
VGAKYLNSFYIPSFYIPSEFFLHISGTVASVDSGRMAISRDLQGRSKGEPPLLDVLQAQWRQHVQVPHLPPPPRASLPITACIRPTCNWSTYEVHYSTVLQVRICTVHQRQWRLSRHKLGFFLPLFCLPLPHLDLNWSGW